LTAQVLMLASGFAGLGYQIVWTQQCALWLGHEAAAVLAVVAAFFGGLAVGAMVLGPRLERTQQPVRWYAACEWLIALWCLLLIPVMPPFSSWMLQLTGVYPTPAWQWTVAFGGSFLLLLPATTAMGATLPAMERLLADYRGGGRCIATVYASNTLGAVAGVLTTAFWLIPAIGLAHTTLLCAALNLLCGAAALLLFRGATTATPAPPAQRAGAASAATGVLARLALTGLLGIGYEVLVVRVLSQVAEDTVYTFAMLLAVYLTGTASGAAVYQRMSGPRSDRDRWSNRLFIAMAAACTIGITSLWFAERTRELALHWLGPSMGAALAAEALLALLSFGLPTLVMGALFSHLCATAHAAGHSFGRALACNTLGACVAPLLFGVLALPLLGPKFALLALAFGYLTLVSWRAWPRPATSLPAAALLALACWAPPLAFIEIPNGGQVLSYSDGVMASVSVVEDAAGVARLRIDNRQQEGSSDSWRADSRQALLPLLLHPAPRRALFLGLGTGVTASAATLYPGIRVDAVELLPEVISASEIFARRLPGGAPEAPALTIIADARRFVRASEQRFDVIVADNFHPARSGSGSLYTVEHFAAVRERLDERGIFCQWLPLHQLDLQTLRSIVRSFVAVYPDGWAMLASNSLETPVLGLLGRRDGARFSGSALRLQLAGLQLPEALSGIGLDDEFAVLGSFVAGPGSLQKFAAQAPLNTDDHPVVAYSAPRITYAPDSQPRDRLIELLSDVSIMSSELVADAPDAAWTPRLTAYWAARDQFIRLGRDIQLTSDPLEMLRQLREPMLAVLRLSPDFRPAYDPLLNLAGAVARYDSADARRLLTALAQTSPARPEAALLLQELGQEPR
jgi:spermidine synthase